MYSKLQQWKFWDEDIQDVKKIIKFFEESGILLEAVLLTIENKTKYEEVVFLVFY